MPDRPADAQRCLLLDNRVVEHSNNVELVLGTVAKHPANPLFGEDRPWEHRFDNLYANVLYDEEDGVFKCWYSPFIVDHTSLGMAIDERYTRKYKAPPDREMGICYAVSDDGITWTKPEVGLVDYDGSTTNNILWRGPHGTGIFKDRREPDPTRRYKALLKSKLLSVAFSEDGIHWGAAIACPDADSAGDTHNNAFWSPSLNRYVGVTRQWVKPNGRQVSRTESEDFINWKPTENVLEGENPNLQTYAMPVFVHAGVYLGLIAIHEQSTDRVWTELTCSTDTHSWQRILPGTPFIDNDGDEGDYDWGCVYAAASPVFEASEIRIYYGASDGLHTGWRNGFFCLATLRPDGFAGYRAHTPGSITTTPLYNGGVLRVTADVAAGGSLKVCVLDASGEAVLECKPITGTVTDTEVQWLGSVSATGEPARLRFELDQATAYSFVMG